MPAKHIKLEFNKTYATEANATKAADKAYGNFTDTLRYVVIPVVTDKGLRYGVAFLGSVAIQNGVHFHFNVIG